MKKFEDKNGDDGGCGGGDEIADLWVLAIVMKLLTHFLLSSFILNSNLLKNLCNLKI